ncbi:MAG: hypothetical protein JRJ68_05175 [Deltaproteobacteria bacterium]|nr:hypothetical protein [Deltaproteobacteria bacterium]
MKPHILLLSTILLLLTGCALERQGLLPELTPAAEMNKKSRCAAVFPVGKWQFVHAIDFTMGNGAGTGLIGVTSLNGNDIECALITVEGLTLFEAALSEDNDLKIRRSVPPFDNLRFAEGLMHDLQTLFLPPSAKHVKSGLTHGTNEVCRYIDSNGKVTDILPELDNCWQINIYNSNMTLNRSITGRSCKDQGAGRIPGYLELNSYGTNRYKLKMTLIRADKI